MKCNQPRPGFELGLLCPFPTMITITQWTPPVYPIYSLINGILPSCSYVSTTICLHHLNFMKHPEKKGSWKQRMVFFNKCLWQHLWNSSCKATDIPSHKSSKPCWLVSQSKNPCRQPALMLFWSCINLSFCYLCYYKNS